MTKKVELPKSYSSVKVEQKSTDIAAPKVEQAPSKPSVRPGSFAELISK
jgi:hypothetical protein